MAISLINQTIYLLRRQIEALGEAFKKEGGFRERMTRIRLEERRKGNQG
jgi:four helix bundle suffix protein